MKRGAYLVETIGCVQCHSPVDENKRILPGMKLAGGGLEFQTARGTFVTAISPPTRRPAWRAGPTTR